MYLLLLAGVTVSCKSYMVSTIATETKTPLNPQNAFLVENDSLRITYDFSGTDAPLKIGIYNKLKEPVYINWNNSALIIRDKAYSFTESNILINGSTSSAQYRDRTPVKYTTGTIQGSAILPVNENFIPPSSEITKEINLLGSVEFTDFPKTEYKKTAVNLHDGSGVLQLKKADFQPDNSPLKFRSYITLHTLKQGIPQTFSSTGSFYIASITKTNANPGKISEFHGKPGNIMVTSNISAAGKALAGVAIVGTVGGLAVANEAITEHNRAR